MSNFLETTVQHFVNHQLAPKSAMLTKVQELKRAMEASNMCMTMKTAKYLLVHAYEFCNQLRCFSNGATHHVLCLAWKHFTLSNSAK
jgi:hypothetical protein